MRTLTLIVVAVVSAVGGYGADRWIAQPIACVAVAPQDPFAAREAQRRKDIDAVRAANPDRLQ